MTFIVVLVALLIERFFDLGYLRSWQWYASFQQLIYKRLAKQSGYMVLAVQILPILFITLFIDFVTSGVWFGFLRLLFGFIVLIYCLGPENLWADTFIHINALNHDQASTLDAPVSPPSFSLRHIFIEANERIFAVIFWFAIFGPLGAVLYRLLTLSLPETEPQAGRCQAILDWVPARLFTFIFALGGHFTRVLGVWKKDIRLGLSMSQNHTILAECGMAAIDEKAGAEREALNLLDRVFIIVLVLVAVMLLSI